MTKAGAVAISILTLAVAASAASPQSAQKALDRARKQIAQGEGVIASARKIQDEAARMRKLRLAKRYFHWARNGAGNQLERLPNDDPLREPLQTASDRATNTLVDLLNEEAAYYLRRGAKSQAKRRVAEVLKLRPKNARALAMQKVLSPRRRKTSDSRAAGQVESRRADERRRKLGLPQLPRRPAVGGIVQRTTCATARPQVAPVQ